MPRREHLDPIAGRGLREVHWSGQIVPRPELPGCCGTPSDHFIVARPGENGWRLLMQWATAQGPVTL